MSPMLTSFGTSSSINFGEDCAMWSTMSFTCCRVSRSGRNDRTVSERCVDTAVVGSTTVYPAADFPQTVLRRGGCVIEVNPEETDFSELATYSLRGPAGAVLTRVLHHFAAAEATR